MENENRLVLARLYVYPVKSCRGVALEESCLDAYGLAHDREWMLVDPDGRFLTQREHPRMARIAPALTDEGLELRAPGISPLVLLRDRSDRGLRKVRIWGDEVWAVDEGDEAAGWLSAALGIPCRLVRRDPEFMRRVPASYAISSEDRVGFADGFPLLLISQASLDDLNARLPRPVGMERFRPNLVIAGCDPYEEDIWKVLRINEITLHAVKPCSRCTIPTVDPGTGERDPRGEPLRTLTRYRRGADGKVYLGQNLVHEPKEGRLRVGDRVRVSVLDPRSGRAE